MSNITLSSYLHTRVLNDFENRLMNHGIWYSRNAYRFLMTLRIAQEITFIIRKETAEGSFVFNSWMILLKNVHLSKYYSNRNNLLASVLTTIDFYFYCVCAEKSKTFVRWACYFDNILQRKRRCVIELTINSEKSYIESLERIVQVDTFFYVLFYHLLTFNALPHLSNWIF